MASASEYVSHSGRSWKVENWIVECNSYKQADYMFRRTADFIRRHVDEEAKCYRSRLTITLGLRISKIRFISVDSAKYVDVMAGYRGKIISGYMLEKYLDDYEKEKPNE